MTTGTCDQSISEEQCRIVAGRTGLQFGVRQKTLEDDSPPGCSRKGSSWMLFNYDEDKKTMQCNVKRICFCVVNKGIFIFCKFQYGKFHSICNYMEIV